MNAILPETYNLVMPHIRGGIPQNPLRVRINSPKHHRRAVFRISQFFRREFQFDFDQYGYEGDEIDPTHVAWLWIHPETVNSFENFDVPCIAACCFRFRESKYGLQWAWFHPYWRRCGLLSKAWPAFRSEFKDFNCEPPLSKAMVMFLKKHDASISEPA
ncbi:MAG TPA: hypothetical protein VK737_10795 [Opitutales bacterium]|jgi:hypothetical protein|nr:hypothetical protein [Opitutales bacterium]